MSVTGERKGRERARKGSAVWLRGIVTGGIILEVERDEFGE